LVCQAYRAKLNELEALAKEKKSQAVIDTIVALRAEKKEIKNKIRDFEAADETTFSKIKANIEKQVSALDAAVSKLAVKLKGKSQSEASR
jgi:hypothetical protein